MIKIADTLRRIHENDVPEDEYRIDPNDPNWGPGNIINAIIGSASTVAGRHENNDLTRYLLSFMSKEQLADLYNKACGMPHDKLASAIQRHNGRVL